jgi:hypothetical protein
VKKYSHIHGNHPIPIAIFFSRAHTTHNKILLACAFPNKIIQFHCRSDRYLCQEGAKEKADGQNQPSAKNEAGHFIQ